MRRDFTSARIAHMKKARHRAGPALGKFFSVAITAVAAAVATATTHTTAAVATATTHAAAAHAAAIVIMVITHATIAAGIPSSVMVIIAPHAAPVIPIHAIMIVIAMTLITIIIMPATTLHVFHGGLTAAAEVHPGALPGLGLHLRLGKLHYAMLFHGLKGGGLNSKTRRNHHGSSGRQKPMHPDSLFHRHSPFHSLFSVGSQARGAFTKCRFMAS